MWYFRDGEWTWKLDKVEWVILTVSAAVWSIPWIVVAIIFVGKL